MKKLLTLLLLLVSFRSNAEAPSFQGFDYGNSMNWGDCFNMNLGVGADVCPGFPIVISATSIYNYQDPVAMTEVTPDPWQSFLYKESFFDFSSQNKERAATGANSVSTMGAGYGNQKKAAGGKEFIGKHRYDTHVWAVSDVWRLKTSDSFSSCLSLTCKTEEFACLGIGNSSFSMSEGTEMEIQSINNNESAEGKGQGYEDSEGNIRYEDGSVSSPKTDENGNRTGGYTETRPAGNYGAGGDYSSASTQAGSSNVTGESAAMDNAGSFDYSSVSQGSGGSSTMAATSALTGKYGASDSSAPASSTGGSASYGNFGGNGKSLPSSTTKGGSTSEPAPLDSSSGNSAQTGNKVSDNAMGNNSAGNQQAANQMKQNIPGADDMGGDGFNQALAMIDRVTYFNPIEQAVQMVATQSPVMVHPVFMTERHKKAAADGGFFLAPLYQTFAQMGAGMIMPLFCLARVMMMPVTAVSEMMGSPLTLDSLGPIGGFIKSRCIGSWGPMDPRVNMIGSGDPFVAAATLSTRGLNIAQNITGDMYNKTINNTPFYKLKFNLDWPHQSSCYGFDGAEGLSRGWTTPVGGILDDVTDVATGGGDISSLAEASTKSVGGVAKQGGYVFTYWRNRTCRYLWSCSEWRGDTGI